MKSQTIRWVAAVLMILLCRQLSAQRYSEPRKFFLKETTFHEFAYPNGSLDQSYTDVLIENIQKHFPKTEAMLVESYITMDKIRPVVMYYSNLCGQRFIQEGNRFTYVFSEIDGRPATRVEVCPMEIGRIHREFWPTRVNIYFIQKPIIAASNNLNRSIDDLKKRIGSYCYAKGTLDEEIAQFEWEEYGKDSEVYVIVAKDDFETVHLYFRRLYGAFYVRMAMDGNMFTRDFEIDISHCLGPADQDKVLIITVEENPTIVDRANNSQLYRGHVFIKYVFWKKTEEELKQMRLKQTED